MIEEKTKKERFLKEISNIRSVLSEHRIPSCPVDIHDAHSTYVEFMVNNVTCAKIERAIAALFLREGVARVSTYQNGTRWYFLVCFEKTF